MLLHQYNHIAIFTIYIHCIITAMLQNQIKKNNNVWHKNICLPFFIFWESYVQSIGIWKHVHIKLTPKNADKKYGVFPSKAASVYFKEGNKSYQPAKTTWISQYGNKQAYQVLRNSPLKCRIYNLLYVMFNVKKGNNSF